MHTDSRTFHSLAELRPQPSTRATLSESTRLETLFQHLGKATTSPTAAEQGIIRELNKFALHCFQAMPHARKAIAHVFGKAKGQERAHVFYEACTKAFGADGQKYLDMAKLLQRDRADHGHMAGRNIDRWIATFEERGKKLTPQR